MDSVQLRPDSLPMTSPNKFQLPATTTTPSETEFPLLDNAVALPFWRQGKEKPYLMSGWNSIIFSLVLI
jgi:hypothetical protein